MNSECRFFFFFFFNLSMNYNKGREKGSNSFINKTRLFSGRNRLPSTGLQLDTRKVEKNETEPFVSFPVAKYCLNLIFTKGLF